MAISIKCATCGKRYQAADHMAGRRVRCKHCGTTFQLPAQPTSDDPFEQSNDTGAHAPAAAAPRAVFGDEDPAGGIGLSTTPEDDDAPVRLTPSAEVPSAGGRSNYNDDEPYDANAEVDSVFQDAFQEYAPARGNTPFVFPGSHLLDRWLPHLLVVISIAWLAYQTLGSTESEPAWVGAVRLLVILLTYCGVVFPLCLKGVRMAARKLNFDLPSGAPWRAFATFLLPVTIGCVVWLSSASVPGFIFGTLMGLIVALPIMWLLFRIRPDDAPVSLGYGAGAFGGAVLASAVILTVVNFIVVTTVRATKAQHSLAMSPFGPGFTWDAPVVVTKTTKPKPAAPQRPKRAEPVTATTRVVFADTAPLPAPVSTQPAPEGVAPATQQATAVAAVDQPAPADPAANATQTPAPDPADPATPPADQVVYGPVVSEVRPRMTSAMDALVQPALAGDAFAVVRPSGRADEERVELWSGRDWKAHNYKDFARTQGLVGQYVLNTDGTMLARLADFPFPSAQVYSFAANQFVRPFIKLAPNTPLPILAGFVAKDQLAMLFRAGTTPAAVEVWDVNKIRRLLRFEIPGMRIEPGSYTFSRKGDLLACIVRDDAAGPEVPGRLEVYNVATGQLTRKITIDELQWNQQIRPAGLCFNEKGDKIAVLFQHLGQGLFLCWGAGGNIPIHQHVYPGGLLPQGVRIQDFKGSPFTLVDDGMAWMIYGASVFDTKQGHLLGDLKIKNVVSQRAVSRDTVLLEQVGDDGKHTMLEVRLDVNRARRLAAGGEAAAAPARE